MQLSFDAADRLVELIHARRGAVGSEEAARVLFALERAPASLAHSLLADVVDGDARLAWLGARVGLADGTQPDMLIEDAELVVFDLETTGLSASRDRICEIGAVRVKALEIDETFETLVDPGVALPPTIARLTGLRDAELRAAPRPELAVRRFLAFAGDAPLAAHNARFDVGFLDRAVQRLTGRRVAAPVVDTVWLARRLLHRRSERFSLAQLAHFFGTSCDPCHRALPDALATAEILVALLGLAQERGARTLAEVIELAAPRARRLHGKRSLVAGAPTTPGVYLFRDRNDTVLYVGKARDLRARLRSYFAGDRQRPAVEAALGALERVEWRELGSELEASLEELRLIRELRPAANARGGRPQSYLERRADRWAVVSTPTRFGPIASKRRAQLAARALGDFDGDDLSECASPAPRRAPSPRARSALRGRRAATRSRRGARGGRGACRRARPASRPGALRPRAGARAGLLARVRRRARTCDRSERSHAAPPGRLEIEAGLARPRTRSTSLAPEDAADLLVVAGVLRRPPPELRDRRPRRRRDPRRVAETAAPLRFAA